MELLFNRELMNADQAINDGRELLREQEWSAAFSKLTAPDVAPFLGPIDLEGVAKAAYLLGNETDGSEFYRRAHEQFLNLGQAQDAARCAFWLGFMCLINGELAMATGWLSRAERLLASQPDCCEKGYLLLPIGYRATFGGDPAAAHSAFVSAGEIGNRFGDKDLITMALQGQGRSLIRQGEIDRGVTLLDEAMVGVTAGEVSPMIAGAVYCSVIEGCSEIFDLRRAREWTAALEKWCLSQPDIVPYRGHCRVRRAEILQLEGAWRDAMDEAQQASEWLSKPRPRPEVGAALYCKAELHRFRGEFAEAEATYGEAAQWDRTQPGIAQLRLAQGQLEAANAAIRRIAEEVRGSMNRARVLDAYVEIVLAVNDVAAARVAADELAEIAEQFQAPLLVALSSRAVGAVLLAEQDARRALSFLRQSWATWCDLEAPFEASRTAVLTALACRELGDEDAAKAELSAARKVFESLGAVPDLARTEALLIKSEVSVGGLTSREVEVLRLIASGLTNRAIAEKLHISQKTVARHVSNIFVKLDLPSRSAATAYAYQHGLV
jgi:DNA-binding NarL/FixJ family response regulator